MTTPSQPPRARARARRPLAALARAALAHALALGLALAARLSPGALVLNEVLYDPAGEDAGAEFVELWNSGDTPVALDSVVIEAGDGARPGAWSVVFAGAPGESVAARSPYLVAGDRLTGPLQNGPDAVRLARGGVVLDRLGWGALSDPGFYEGAPAPDVPSGSSLARRADGADTDRNDADWEPSASPTPGAANRPDYGVRTVGPATLDPEVIWPGEACTLSLPVLNHGRYALEAAAWSVTLRVRAAPDGAASDGGPPAGSAEWSATTLPGGMALAPGETAVWNGALTPPAAAGAFEASAAVALAGAAEDGGSAVPADTVAAWGRVGVGAVAVNEVAFRDAGAGEWVELLALEDVPSWGGFALGDGSRAVRRLRPWWGGGAGGARGGELRVAVSDPGRFLLRYAIPESLLLVVEGGWLALNDASSSGVSGTPWADGVRLLDPDGVPSDAMRYAASWSARGASLERISARLPSAAPGNWSESVSPLGGTPGFPNSIGAPDLDRPAGLPLLAVPAPVLRREVAGAAAAMVIQVGPAAAGGSVRLVILDLRGRVRRVVADGVRFGGAGAVVWDGRDDAGRPLPAGIYVVRLEATLRSGEPPRRAAVSVAVAPVGGAP